jgi:hypothetical protein
MGRVPYAKLAELFKLKPVRVGFFVFCGVVVALLAFCTGQCDFRPHNTPLFADIKKDT